MRTKLKLAPLGILMKERNVSGGTLAEAIGVNRMTIQDHKYGLAEWRSDTLIRVAEYFDVSTDYLLGLTEDRGKTWKTTKH